MFAALGTRNDLNVTDFVGKNTPTAFPSERSDLFYPNKKGSLALLWHFYMTLKSNF